MKTATVIQHVPFEDLGSFEEVLNARRFEVRTLHAAKDDLSAANVGTPDLLVLMGGPISVNDEARFPFLANELSFVRDWLKADRPCIGVCLGAQLMSKALGGQVRAMQRHEVGWSALELTADGADVLQGFDKTKVLHWHGEEFTIPAGAKHLAGSRACANQAFSFGNNALGLQFHPEVTRAGLEQWYVGHVVELSAWREDVARLRGEGREYAPALRAASARMLESWLARRNLW